MIPTGNMYVVYAKCVVSSLQDDILHLPHKFECAHKETYVRIYTYNVICRRKT